MKKVVVAMAFLALATAEPGFRVSDGVTLRVVFAQAPWVAFDANFARTQPGQRKVVGFFHRGADGSTREESNIDGPSKPVVLITNITRRLQYRLETGAWHSFPINLSPNGWQPDKIDHDPRTYRPASSIETFEVLRFVNPQGLVQFIAPGLNDFPLRTERPNGGLETFSSIIVRDQSAGLFEPPPGSTVQVHSDGATGVIWYPSGQNPPTK